MTVIHEITFWDNKVPWFKWRDIITHMILNWRMIMLNSTVNSLKYILMDDLHLLFNKSFSVQLISTKLITYNVIWLKSDLLLSLMSRHMRYEENPFQVRCEWPKLPSNEHDLEPMKVLLNWFASYEQFG